MASFWVAFTICKPIAVFGETNLTFDLIYRELSRYGGRVSMLVIVHWLPASDQRISSFKLSLNDFRHVSVSAILIPDAANC